MAAFLQHLGQAFSRDHTGAVGKGATAVRMTAHHSFQRVSHILSKSCNILDWSNNTDQSSGCGWRLEVLEWPGGAS